MDDLTRLARSVGGKLEPQWTEEHIDNALASVHAGVRRRRIRTRASAAAAMALVVGFAFFAPWSKATETIAVDLNASAPDLSLAGPLESAPLPAQQQELRFGDRAVALPLMPNTMLIAESVGSDLIELRLEAGAARFNVNKHPGQSFRVYSGPIVIEVLGTEFIVRHADGYVEVSVSEGSVEVRFLGGTASVGTGETRRFPREVSPPNAVARTAGNVAPSRTPQENAGPSQIIHDAGTQLQPAEPAPHAAEQRSEDPPAELLQQADMARLRQEYGLAAQILKRVLAAHPQPDTEVIAAFTLGRVLMDNLDRPVEAAQAFARAHSADSDGNLAEDALAREVEAYWRAGRKDTAQVRAMEYMRLYPAGRRVRMVKRFSGSN